MKPSVLKQKISSLLSRIDNAEFLEALQITLKEQLDIENKETLLGESIQKMHKRQGANPKK